MRIYLIRHAESEGNISGSLTSTTDFVLTVKGIRQAQRLGQHLRIELSGKSISAYCSPLMRAKQTMQNILSCIDPQDVTLTETSDLKEMDLGILEGMPFDEQSLRYPQVDMENRLSTFEAPEGECYQDVKQRVERFCSMHIAHSDAEYILIVSHGITLRVLTNVLLQRPDEDINCLNWFENTAQTVLVSDGSSQSFRVEKLNDYSHLKELATPNYKDWGLFADTGAYLQRLQ